MGMLLLVSALLMGACTHDSDSHSASGNQVTLTVLASNDAISRTTFTEAAGTTSTWPWATGDKLLVVDESSGVVGTLTLTSGAGSTNATFSGSATVNNGQYYRFWYLGSNATYPTSGSSYSVNMASQAGTLASLGAYDITTGRAMVYVEGTTAYAADLTMNKLMATAHFAVSTSPAATLTALTMSGTNIYNAVTLNLKAGTIATTTAGPIAFTTNFSDVYVTLPPATITPVMIAGTASEAYTFNLASATFVAGGYYRQNETAIGAYPVVCSTLYNPLGSLTYNGSDITLTGGAGSYTGSYIANDGTTPLELTPGSSLEGTNATVSVTSNPAGDVSLTYNGSTTTNSVTGVSTTDAISIAPSAAASAVYTITITVGSITTTYTITRNYAPEGALSGLFSVSATKRVFFSQGNLQYKARSNTWRFAYNQYDYIGNAAGNNTAEADRATQSGWIDLFGWGTSGYNNKYPYMVSTTATDYGDGANDIAGTNYDWGVNCAISNGGNTAGLWRTLTQDEWAYLIETRNNNAAYAGTGKYLSFCCRLTISGTTYGGLMVLPDNNNADVQTSAYNSSATDWSGCPEFTSIPEGALFLPAAGSRNGVSVSGAGTYGYYWSSTSSGSEEACMMDLSYNLFGWNNSSYRYIGHSVRLVQDE